MFNTAHATNIKTSNTTLKLHLDLHFASCRYKLSPGLPLNNKLTLYMREEMRVVLVLIDAAVQLRDTPGLRVKDSIMQLER